MPILTGLPTLCLMLALHANTYAAINETVATEFYEEASGYFSTNAYAESVIQLRNTLQNNPNHLPARLLLGRALIRLGQTPQAIKEFEIALSMGGDENLILVPMGRALISMLEHDRVLTSIIPGGHPPDVDGKIYLLHGEAYDYLGNTKQAIEAYLNAGTLIPADPRPLLGQAKIEAARQRNAKAMGFVDQALAVAPNDHGTWLFKAILHRDFREPEAAIEAFERALELQPNSDAAFASRAALWIDLSRLPNARADIDQALALNSANLEAIYLKTLLLFREGRGEQARQELRNNAEFLDRISDDNRAKLPEAQLMLGVVAYFNKNYDKAVAYLSSFLAKTPDHPGARRYLGAALLSLGEYDQVITLLRGKNGAQANDDPAALSLVAEAYRAKGEDRMAGRMYEAAIALAPHDAGLGIRLAQSRFNSGNPKKAVAELERLVQRFPQLHEANLQLARMYVKLGRIDEALDLAERVYQERPNDAVLQNFLGATYMAKGDTDKAEQLLSQAAGADPDNVMVRINLARIALTRNEPATAETNFRTVLEKYPLHEAAGIELSTLLLERGEVEEAEQILERLLKHDPTRLTVQIARLQALAKGRATIEQIRERTLQIVQRFADSAQAYLVAAKVFAQTGDRETAHLYLRRAVERAEFDTNILYRIAVAQTNIRDYNGALWSSKKALQGNPQHLDSALLQVRTLIHLRELDPANEAAIALVEAYPGNSLVIKVLGEVRMAQGAYAEAIEIYEQLFEITPTPMAIQSLFSALLLDDKRDRAMAMMERWIEAYPKDYGSQLYYAQELLSEGHYEAAAAAYETLYAADSKNALILNNLANAYQRLGDERALGLAQTAYESTGEQAAILDTYGWILTESGNADKGLELLRNAHARDSTDPTIRYHIGLALLKLGRTDEAVRELQAALAFNKRFADQAAVQRLLSKLGNGA